MAAGVRGAASWQDAAAVHSVAVDHRPKTVGVRRDKTQRDSGTPTGAGVASAAVHREVAMHGGLARAENGGHGAAQQVDVGNLLCQQTLCGGGSLPRQAAEAVAALDKRQAGVRGVHVVEGQPQRERSGGRERPEAGILMPGLLRGVAGQLAEEMGTPTDKARAQNVLHNGEHPLMLREASDEVLVQRPRQSVCCAELSVLRLAAMGAIVQQQVKVRASTFKLCRLENWKA
mmetsp:Transcript_91878/g.258903  ORF Transcript_91878/g.258903 Transcript_91878/m.258903 type:complete len:231 (+) Transcript_91878:252-944(+)